MHLISSILFGISANMDNFVIGISYGIKKTRISFLSNLIIGLITFLGTILSIGLGMKIADFIPSSVSQVIGSVILIALGGYYAVKSFWTKNMDSSASGNNSAEAKESTTLTIKESAVLGFALTINNIGLGIGASITGIPILSTSLITFFLSMLFLFIGNKIGSSWISRFLHRYAEPLSGLIIIALGIYELMV